MLTEAIHTPFMSDRYLSIENARYIFNNMKNIGDEIEFKKDGIIQRRAQQVLDESVQLLEKMVHDGLFVSLSKGTFANIKRPIDGGKGLDGVFEKGDNYFNPFINKMLEAERP
jgi:beta-lysine 5,6-aminomutase alpha subunit